MGDFRLFCIALTAASGITALIEIATGLHADWTAPERLAARFAFAATVGATVVAVRALSAWDRPA